MDEHTWLEPHIEAIRELIEVGDEAGELIEAAICDASDRGAPALLRAHRAIGEIFFEECDNEQARSHYEQAVLTACEVRALSNDDAEVLLDVYCRLLGLVESEPDPVPPALLAEAVQLIACLSAAFRDQRIDGRAAQLRDVLGPLLARSGQLADAEAQDRALIAHCTSCEPHDAEMLGRAELRLARLLARCERGHEGEVLLRALIARSNEPTAAPSSDLVAAYAALAGLLADRGSGEAAVFEARGRSLAALHCKKPIAGDVLRSLLGPFELDGGDLRWILGERALHESYGAASNPSAIDEHGQPTPGGVRSEVIFGPLRGFSCSCKKYDGFRHWGAICELCRVEVLPAITRSFRFGHVSLASPLVHPASIRLIALLLDLAEAEVLAIRDFEAAAEGGPGAAALQNKLHDVYLEAEAERLAEAHSRGRIRGRAHLIEHRSAAVAAFLRDGLRPEAMILHTIPVLPPEIDVAAHPALRGIDRAEVERAYGRLLVANTEVARLLAEDLPAQTAIQKLQREADALFALFSSPPVPSIVAAPGETHLAAFELLPGTIAKPSFSFGSAAFSAGKAFVVDDPAMTQPLVVTCLHLFGPAGGLPEQLSSEQTAYTITSAILTDAFEGNEIAVSARAIEVPSARAESDFSDVAALLLPSPGKAVRLRLSSSDVANGERVYLAAPVRAGAPASQRLHPATVLARTASGSLLLELDVLDLDVAGASGAPVLSSPNTVVGMFVRFHRGEESGLPLGTMVPASRLRELLSLAVRLSS